MEKFKIPKICPYCGADVVLLSNKAVYTRIYGNGLIYKCSRCGSYVGTHKGTTIPLGTLANAELRKYRKQAHYYFDQLWKHGQVSREEAYEWLSKQLQLPKEKTHIGMFDRKQCEQTIYFSILELNKRGKLWQDT